MRCTSNNGNTYLLAIDSEWKRRVRSEVIAEIESGKVNPLDSNVVGGSLDGERMPEGTRDGQQYRWDSDKKRWRHVR